MQRFKYLVNILIVLLLLGAVAIGRGGRIGGVSVSGDENNTLKDTIPTKAIVQNVGQRKQIIESTEVGRDVLGYAGNTPVRIVVEDDVIQSVEMLEHIETPSYVRLMKRAGLLDSWNGVILENAANMQPDAVSGATITSIAVIKNVQLAAASAVNIEIGDGGVRVLDVKTIAGLLVIISGVCIVLLKSRNKVWIILQMVLNVVVLGAWCNSFLSLSLFVSWISNGFNILVLLPIVMLGVVVVLPLFGRRGTHCYTICPLGSAQTILHKIPLKKIKPSPKITKILNKLRYYILALLLFLMWIGVGFNIMDYEIFPIFIPNSASVIIIIMAIIFLLLSLFVNKPYCRFVCPTGALITITEKTSQ